MASPGEHKHRPVNKLPVQLVDTILSKALATLLGRKKFDAAVLGGSACSIGRWLNSECVHQQIA
jgi:hypothetical protein